MRVGWEPRLAAGQPAQQRQRVHVHRDGPVAGTKLGPSPPLEPGLTIPFRSEMLRRRVEHVARPLT
jgi:hypothetical protein